MNIDFKSVKGIIRSTNLSEWKAQDVNLKYKQEHAVGAGTFGLVYKGFMASDPNQVVALKKLDLSHEKEGFPITALREIKILRMLDHANVVKLLEIAITKAEAKQKQSTFLVFEYVQHDFLGLMKNHINFTVEQLKCTFLQIFKGVEYLHSKHIIHRDIKSANILYNNRGQVKIADFGLAIEEKKKYTNKVVTLWYRAPELLFGSEHYDNKIDIWSIGCLLAEIVLGRPLLQGDKEAKQIELIYQCCGTPESENWHEAKDLKYYKDLAPKFHYLPRSLISKLQAAKDGIDELLVDLIDQCLQLDPKHRPSASEALKHKYFSSEPHPCSVNQMPNPGKDLHGQLQQQNKQQVKQQLSNQNQNKNYTYNNSSQAKNFKWNKTPTNIDKEQIENENEQEKFQYSNVEKLKDQINHRDYDQNEEFNYSPQKKIKPNNDESQFEYEKFNEKRQVLSLTDI